MTINFTNKLFSHFFITISNILPNHIYSINIAYNIIDINLFSYITINQYLFK